MNETVARLAIQTDVSWLPADTFTFRFTSTLDRLHAAAKAAGVVLPAVYTIARTERELTTIMVEGDLPP